MIASASLTPVHMNNAGDLKTASTHLQTGLQFSDYRVSAFVNLALVKNWAENEGLSGELAGGLMFKNSGTSAYMVVPISTNSMPRVQMAVTLDQKRSSAFSTGPAIPDCCKSRTSPEPTCLNSPSLYFRGR